VMAKTFCVSPRVLRAVKNMSASDSGSGDGL
jgi:hypothetical protein